MNGYLFEESDALHNPVECFFFNTTEERFPVSPHWHYFAEMLYVLKGRLQVNDGEASYLLTEGDMILLHPKCVHSVYSEGEEKPEFAAMKFDINRLTISASYAPKLRSIFRSAERKEMPVHFKKEVADRLDARDIFFACIEEMHGQQYGYESVAQTRICELLLKMIRYWQTQGFQVDSSVYEEDVRYDIYSITEYIDRHMSEGVPVTEIARKCGMSYSYFAKKFLAVYGKTCKEYMESMRVYKAEEYLIFTDFDLNYISQETGFSDCSHLIKSFKRLKGITPKQFRMAHSTSASGRR